MHCLVCKKLIPKNSSKKLCLQHSNSQLMFKSVNLIKSQDFSGKSPNIFVGEYGYPNVNVGILSPPERKEDAWLYDAPRFWAEQDFNKNNVISLRSSLINSKFQAPVKVKSSRFLDLAQEVSMASKPVDIDFMLYNKPTFKLNLNDITMPHGPKADLKKVILAENPSIPKKIDKVVSDTDLKSVEAIKTLYNKDVNENDLIKLLSIGNLGIKMQRRLVPTKWSITAIHDQLGKMLIKEVKDHNSADYALYFNGYMNNYFMVMIFPDVWGYELFETYVSENSNYTTDHEFYQGRKTYASNCVGGYYANRLAVLEKLKQLKKQASVLVLRFTTPDYDTPLGVWVVSEASKKSLTSIPIKFDSKEKMLSHAKNLIKNKFNIDIDIFLNNSKILSNLKSQSKLTKFF